MRISKYLLITVSLLIFIALFLGACSSSTTPYTSAVFSPSTFTTTVTITTNVPAFTTTVTVTTDIPPITTTETVTSTTWITVTTTPSSIETGELAYVLRVIDGDTIEVILNGGVWKVRYIGIDTPETSGAVEPYGLEATAKNRELVEGKTVRLEKDISETDQYGRLLRYVYAGDLFVNTELVRQGYAQVNTYPPDVKYQALFLQLQQEAMAASLGLWGLTSTPAVADDSDIVYITKTGSKYHRAGCRYLSADAIPIPRAEAIARGYTPCSVCKP